MRTRIFLFLLIGILLGGCVENQLSGTLLDTCLSASETHVIRTPNCETSEACIRDLDQRIPFTGFVELGIGTEIRSSERGIAEGWKAIRNAEQSFEQIHEACRNGNSASLITQGIMGVNRLKEALKQNENASEWALISLSRAAQKGNALELQRVRDTQAFQAYAKILQLLQDVSAETSTQDETRGWNAGQTYFARVEEAITDRTLPAYRINESSVFDIYRTVLQENLPRDGQPIRLLAPVWQSAIIALTRNRNAERGIELVQQVQAGEVLAHIEDNLSPPDGSVYQMLNEINRMEEGIAQLKAEEQQTFEQLGDRIEKLEEKVQTLDEREEVWENVQALHANWMNVIGENSVLNQPKQWKNTVHALRARMEELRENTARNQHVLGRRIQEKREFSQEVGNIEHEMEMRDTQWKEWNTRCQGIVDWIQENDPNPLHRNAIETWNRDPNCAPFLQQLGEPSTITENGMWTGEGALAECVQELTSYRDTMELAHEGLSTEYFRSEWGDESAIQACEAARMHARTEYDAQTNVIEMHALQEEIRTWIQALGHARGAFPDLLNRSETDRLIAKAQEGIEDAEEIMNHTTIEKTIQKLEEIREEMGRALDEIAENETQHMTWAVVSPSSHIQMNQPIDVNWTIHWTNPFGRTILRTSVWTIPLPFEMNDIQTENNGDVEWNEENAIVTVSEWPEEGVTLHAHANGILIHTSEHTQVMTVRGTIATLETRLTLESPTHPLDVEWNWRIPEGEDPTRIRGWVNGENTHIRVESTRIWGDIRLEDKNGYVQIQHENSNAIRVDVQATPLLENEAGARYDVRVTSNLVEEATFTLRTSIREDPIQVRRVQVWDQEGNAIPFHVNGEWGIEIPNVTMHAFEEKKWVVQLETIGDAETWSAILENVLASARELQASENSSISIQAAKIVSEITELMTSGNVAEWIQKLPAIQTKLETLREKWREWQYEWNATENDWRVTRNQLDQIEEEIPTNIRMLLEWGEREVTNQKAPELKRILNQIKNWLNGKRNEIVNVRIVDANVQGDMNFQSTLEQLNEGELELKAYQREQALPCSKLAVVGFVCPISEDAQKSMGKTINDYQSELEKTKKKWNAWSAEQKMENRNAIKTRENEIRSFIEKTRATIRDSREIVEQLSEELILELEKSAIEEESSESRGAVEKARLAQEGKEYGKVIYIAKNLLTYAKSKSPLTGLSALPGPVWIVGGVIVLAGGIWARKTWKQKNQVKPIPVAIPRHAETTRTAESMVQEESRGGGDDNPHMQGENPAAFLAPTGLESSPRPDPKFHSHSSRNPKAPTKRMQVGKGSRFPSTRATRKE